MVSFLIKCFIPNHTKTDDTLVREKYTVLAGILGIVCNVFLFILKFIIGFISNSIAITSDSFNNLADSGTSLISLISAKMSNRKPDREHPFGHGRIEYVSALIVAFLTMMLGVELLKTSVGKIISPTPANFNLVMIICLVLSVPIKVWMYLYNKKMGKMINSSVLIATAIDSKNDVISTISIIVASILAKFFNLPIIDAIIGLLVSLIIIKAGLDTASDTVGLLLGKPPEKETVDKLQKMLLDEPEIVGVHDLVIHDYGPGRKMASVHAEVSDKESVVKIHEIIDRLEHEITKETGIHMVIHMDPIAVDCEKTSFIKQQVSEIIKNYNDQLRFHDFRMTDGEKNINLIFDIEIPQNLMPSHKKIVEDITNLLKEADSRYSCVIDVDPLFL